MCIRGTVCVVVIGYIVEYYCITFYFQSMSVCGFLQVLWFNFTNKTDLHNITEILWKVALNTVNQPNHQLPLICKFSF